MKTAWALGAAFVAVVLVLIVFAVMATEMGSAERLSSTEKFDGIDVPVIGTVGDFPDPAHRLVVNVTADGTIVVDGRTLTFDALEARLATLDPGRGEFSPKNVVLRMDGGLPWGATSQVLIACATHSIDKTWFGVRHEGDGEEGAIAACLPTHVGGEAVPKDADSYGAVEQRIAVLGREGRSDASGVYAEVRKTRAATPKDLLVTLDVDPRVPTRTAIALLDASLRAGAHAVEFAFGAPPRRGEARAAFETAALVGTVGSPAILMTGAAESAPHEVPAGTAPMPPLERTRGRPAGIVYPPNLDLPPQTDAARR